MTDIRNHLLDHIIMFESLLLKAIGNMRVCSKTKSKPLTLHAQRIITMEKQLRTDLDTTKYENQAFWRIFTWNTREENFCFILFPIR